MTSQMHTGLIAVAFGDPLHVQSFSGLSCRLFSQIREMGRLAGTLSSGNLRSWDYLTGRLDFRALYTRGRHLLSRSWLWHPATLDRLSRRFERQLPRFPDAAAVLQVGTHVCIRRPGLVHACITDLTIKQAVDAGRFGFERLGRRDLDNAMLVQRRVFDSCDVVFVLSEWARQSVIRDFQQDPDKVLAVGAGANIEPLAGAPGKYESRNILFVGLEWETKGGPLLLNAWRIVRQSLPDATVTIVGVRPPVTQPGVTVLGPLRRSEPAEYERLKRAYQQASCFCLLSEFDAFPNVLLEAQYTGTPVVALDRQSRREAVRDGQTGVLVQQARPEAVAEALLQVLRSSETARQMGERGRQLVSSRFTWPIVAGTILRRMGLATGHVADAATPLPR